MRIIGLTGSIGMGKSATAAKFAEAGVPVHDADAAVHRLYNGAAAKAVESEFPGVSVEGRVDRTRLAQEIVGKPEALARLEAIVHPLVRQSEEEFLRRAKGEGRPLVVLDIPLLFETGAEARVDTIVVVTADAAVQRERVLARPGMTAEKFESLLARQAPDLEKRRQAHFVIDTGRDHASARRQVASILRALA